MKSISVLLALGVFLLSACKEANSVQEEREVMVGLMFNVEGEEIRSAGKSDITSANDLYAVQVRSALRETSPEMPYSYGLFDDPSAIVLNLVTGKFYNVVVTCVKDGTNLIKQSDGKYGKPFDDVFGMGVKVENKLILSKVAFNSLSTGASDLATGTYIYPDYDRYYGESGLFLCEAQNAISIDLKRVIFSLDISADENAKTKVVIDGAPEIVLNPKEKRQVFYCFAGGKSATWTSDDYSEIINFEIFTEKNGTYLTTGSKKQVKVQRRYKYPLSTNAIKGGGLSLVFEDDLLFEGNPISSR